MKLKNNWNIFSIFFTGNCDSCSKGFIKKISLNCILLKPIKWKFFPMKLIFQVFFQKINNLFQNLFLLLSAIPANHQVSFYPQTTSRREAFSMRSTVTEKRLWVRKRIIVYSQAQRILNKIFHCKKCFLKFSIFLLTPSN